MTQPAGTALAALHDQASRAYHVAAERPAVLSVFSGIGGLDLGLQRAGMRIVGQVEIDPWCRAVLARHWPDVPRHDDARTCVPWWRARLRPRVHVVAAGFPCQPVSLAGPQRGTDDPRWLWPAVADVLRDLRPDYALLENVTGLLVRGLGDVLGELAEIGYDAEWDCIPAAALGAPHIRDRVFILAYAASDRRHPRRPSDTPQEPRGREPDRSRLRADVAHADRAGRRAGRGLGRAWPPPLRADWWRTEPSVGRSHDGLPAGLDSTDIAAWERGIPRTARAAPQRIQRLGGLGNAVVPQVAEYIGRFLVAHFHTTTPESE